MQIKTKVFGEITIDDDKIIDFPNGIVGFPDLVQFTLIHDEEKGICRNLIRLVMGSAAGRCIIPIQDYLQLDNTARINQPSTLGTNWKWRLTEGQFTEELQKEMLALATRFGRRNWTLDPEEEK